MLAYKAAPWILWALNIKIFYDWPMTIPLLSHDSPYEGISMYFHYCPIIFMIVLRMCSIHIPVCFQLKLYIYKPYK